jgi:hypothetical protein
MEVSDKLLAGVLWEGISTTNYMRGWVGPRASLDELEKRTCLCNLKRICNLTLSSTEFIWIISNNPIHIP